MIYYCSNCKSTAMRVFNTTDGLYEDLCKTCFDKYEKRDKVEDTKDALKHLIEFRKKLTAFENRLVGIEKELSRLLFSQNNTKIGIEVKPFSQKDYKGGIENGNGNNQTNKKDIATRLREKK